MAKRQALTLEEKLLFNAVDTVVKNRDDIDAAALIHLVEEILKRDDLAPSIHRLLATALPPGEMAKLGISHGMAGTDDEAMNYLTMPRLHRTLLRGVQQMQETLMPGGYLLKNKDIDHGDAARLIRDCTAQLEKVLRLTKATKANAEVLRLKEAIAAGLTAIGEKLGPAVRDEAFKVMNGAMQDSLAATAKKLKEEMSEAEELAG